MESGRIWLVMVVGVVLLGIAGLSFLRAWRDKRLRRFLREREDFVDPDVQNEVPVGGHYPPVPRARVVEPESANAYARRLAVALWSKHYQASAPDWKPCDDTLGLLTQIDNMVAGLERKREPAPKDFHVPAARIRAASADPLVSPSEVASKS